MKPDHLCATKFQLSGLGLQSPIENVGMKRGEGQERVIVTPATWLLLGHWISGSFSETTKNSNIIS